METPSAGELAGPQANTYPALNLSLHGNASSSRADKCTTYGGCDGKSHRL